MEPIILSVIFVFFSVKENGPGFGGSEGRKEKVRWSAGRSGEVDGGRLGGGP